MRPITCCFQTPLQISLGALIGDGDSNELTQYGLYTRLWLLVSFIIIIILFFCGYTFSDNRKIILIFVVIIHSKYFSVSDWLSITG